MDLQALASRKVSIRAFAEAGKIGNVGDKYIDNGKALTS